MDVIKSISKWCYSPINNIADVGVRRNITTSRRVCFVSGPRVANGLRNSGIVQVMVLPNISLRIKDGYFPIKRASWRIVLNIHNLPTRPCKHIRSIRRNHIDAVVEIGRACARAVILIGLDDMAHLNDVKWPGINRMGPIGIASRDPCWTGIRHTWNLWTFLWLIFLGYAGFFRRHTGLCHGEFTSGTGK